MVVREMLERLVKQRGMAHSEMEKLLVVAGAKGGVGTTTVAVNLAVQLARGAGKRVVMFDLGRPLGHAALLLDLETRFSFRAAVESLDRLDSHLFSGLLANHKSGVQVLGGASHADEWDRISPLSLARVINVAQSSFDFVVADIGLQLVFRLGAGSASGPPNHPGDGDQCAQLMESGAAGYFAACSGHRLGPSSNGGQSLAPG